MRRRLLFLCGLVLAMGAIALDACWYDVPDVVTDALAPEAGDAGGGDAGADVAIVDANDGGCDPDAAFGAPQPLTGFTDPNYDERYPRLSPDELTLYYAVGPVGGVDEVHMATRASVSDNFGLPGTLIPGIGSGGSTVADENIGVSDDALAALLATHRPSANVIAGATQIFFASRSSADASFSAPMWSGSTWGSQCGDLEPYFGQGKHFFSTYVPSINSTSCTSNHELQDGFFANGYLDGGWLNFSFINTPADEFSPVVTASEDTLFFASNRGLDGGGTGPVRIWASTHRATLQWPTPSPVQELVTLPPGIGNPRPGWISQNGCRLYMTVHNTGATPNSDDIYVATRGK